MLEEKGFFFSLIKQSFEKLRTHFTFRTLLGQKRLETHLLGGRKIHFLFTQLVRRSNTEDELEIHKLQTTPQVGTPLDTIIFDIQ